MAREVAAYCSSRAMSEGECESLAMRRIAGVQDESGVRIDPATILLIIQAAIAIYKFLKEMGWLDRASAKFIAEKVG